MHHSEQSGPLNVVSNKGLNSSFAFDNADHGSLGLVASHRSASSALAPSAHVRFVNLNRFSSTADRLSTIFQHGANLLKHTPRGFIRDARFPLNLLCRNSAARLCHEVDRVEPSRKRRRRFVEDRSSSWVNVMTTAVARIRGTTHHAMMFSCRFALLAINTVRIKAIAEPLQTGRIIGKLCLEVPERVGLHGRFAVAHSDYLQ